MNNFPYWLTKPMMAGARRFNLDAYLLALEGWRRGLTLRWYHDVPPESDIKLIGFNPVGKIFSLSNGEKTHYFYRSRGDLVSSEAVDIAGDKFKTKELFLKKNVDTPKGKNFAGDVSSAEIVGYAQEMGVPVTIKPTLGSLGKGVFTNLTSESDFEYAVNFIREELDYQDIIVEEFVDGIDVRLYVVNDEVVAATKREPASVIGDGIHAIEKLIEARNEERKKNPQLSTRLVQVSDELKNYLDNQNLKIDTIPDKGKRIFLSGKANVSSGGDSINAESIPAHAKQQAIQALNALPNIPQGGVDLIFNDERASVLEINATAGIVLHILPAIGQPIRVEEKIINYYFPGTKANRVNDRLYFNYNKVNELLTSRLVNHLEVTNVDETPLNTKKYIVKGKVQGVFYRKFVQNQATKLGLNGYVRNLKNKNVVIVVGSKDEDILREFKKRCYEGPENAEVKDIIEEDWDKQINIGFEIRKTSRK